MISEYRVFRHDLPNLRGTLVLHEVSYDPTDGRIQSWYMRPAKVEYHDNEDALESMLSQVEEMKQALLNPKFESFKDLVPERLPDEQMTLMNALYHADPERIFLGIYHKSDPSEIVWVSMTGTGVGARFMNKVINNIIDVPKSELDKRITFSLRDEHESILMEPNTLRIIAEFNYLLGEDV